MFEDFKKFETDRAKYVFERQKEIAKHIQSNFFFGPMLIV